MKTFAAIVLLAALPLGAQESPTVSLDAICRAADAVGETATESAYRANPSAYADDFCALARYGDGHRAARQLSKAVGMVRRFNNPNRYYFDPRRGGVEAGSEYIQLLRPWMIEENKAGTAKWEVVQASPGVFSTFEHRTFIDQIEIIDRDDQKPCTRSIAVSLSRMGMYIFQPVRHDAKLTYYTRVRVNDGQSSILNAFVHESTDLEIKNFVERELDITRSKVWDDC